MSKFEINRYPNNPDVYGPLAGQKIRVLKTPDTYKYFSSDFIKKIEMTDYSEPRGETLSSYIHNPTFCSYVHFKRRMKVLKRSMKLIRFLEKGIQALDEGHQQPDFGGYLLDEYIKMLADIMHDEQDSIAAFVWDDNWGEKGQVKSIKQLYKKLTSES